MINMCKVSKNSTKQVIKDIFLAPGTGKIGLLLAIIECMVRQQQEMAA